jgi:hypothetical protein
MAIRGVKNTALISPGLQQEPPYGVHRYICSTHPAWSLILPSSDNMNPERALQEQIKRYQRMTGEQRLAIALDLHELACNVARQGIRYQNPNADEAEVERLLRQRLRLALQ